MICPALGQQLTVYSHYSLSPFLINPANAGIFNYGELQSNIRYQWVGMDDAPKTIVLSGNMPIQQKNVGVGGYLFNDRTGPLSRTGMSLAYAYHLELPKSLLLSFGIFGGIIQYRIDGNQIFLADEEERFLFDGIESTFVPDASLGIRLEGDRWYAGLALNHLLHNKIKSKPSGNAENSYGTLEYHAFIMGGYLLPINKNFEMTPSVLIKVLPNNVMQVDVSAKLSYQHKFWGGVSYRSADILSVLAGYDFNEKLYAGYAYDLTTKGLKNYSAGSHELVLGYRLINDHTKKETRRTLD